MSVEEFKRAFRAASDNALLDQLVRCDSCSLAYVNPRARDTLIISGYADATDQVFVEQNPERIKTFTRLLRRVLRSLAIPASSDLRILDVGCAGGAFLVAARICGLQAVGIEPSRWLAEFGRKTYDVEIHDGILEAGRFPNSTFDLVSLWDVIEHVPDPVALLRTAHSILKPDGNLLVSYPDYGSWAARLLGNRWPFLLSVHLFYFTRATMTDLLRRTGFTAENVRPYFPTLTLGYLLERMTGRLGAAARLRRLAQGLQIDHVPICYNMGQTLVVARRL
jgi:2-polyprenyl-3-methyl-5-hydroxy-6-metoxy-1,4-benzoquinol methylase